MKVSYEEELAVVPLLDGTFICQISWRDVAFQEVLPRGIERWSEAEFKAHLTNFVIPRLQVQLLKAKRAALEAANDSEIPSDVLPTVEYSEQDVRRLTAAQLKRARKQMKLVH